MLFVGKECFDMQHSHEAMTYQDEVIDEHEPAEKKILCIMVVHFRSAVRDCSIIFKISTDKSS